MSLAPFQFTSDAWQFAHRSYEVLKPTPFKRREDHNGYRFRLHLLLNYTEPTDIHNLLPASILFAYSYNIPCLELIGLNRYQLFVQRTSTDPKCSVSRCMFCQNESVNRFSLRE